MNSGLISGFLDLYVGFLDLYPDFWTYMVDFLSYMWNLRASPLAASIFSDTLTLHGRVGSGSHACSCHRNALSGEEAEVAQSSPYNPKI